MRKLAPGDVRLALGRALWGEVSGRLRVVRFRTIGNHIDPRFFFDGEADDDERDSIGFVGAEVAADLPDTTVSEEAITAPPGTQIACQEDWHTAYARKEPSLAG